MGSSASSSRCSSRGSATCPGPFSTRRRSTRTPGGRVQPSSQLGTSHLAFSPPSGSPFFSAAGGWDPPPPGARHNRPCTYPSRSSCPSSSSSSCGTPAMSPHTKAVPYYSRRRVPEAPMCVSGAVEVLQHKICWVYFFSSEEIQRKNLVSKPAYFACFERLLLLKGCGFPPF